MTLRAALDLVKSAVIAMEQQNESPYFNIGRMEILLAQAISEVHGPEYVVSRLKELQFAALPMHEPKFEPMANDIMSELRKEEGNV